MNLDTTEKKVIETGNLEVEEIDYHENIQDAPDADTDNVDDENVSTDEADEVEVSVTFGDEAEGEDSPDGEEGSLPNHLRKMLREERKRNRKLKNQLKDLTKSVEVEDEVAPPEPTLEGFDYDNEAYAKAMRDWAIQNAKIEDKKKLKQKEQELEAAEFEKKRSSYHKMKETFSKRAPDFDDAEEEIVGALSQARQGMLLDVAKSPAMLVYALGKNPKKLQEIASIKNDAHFIAALVRAESEMKVSEKTNSPKPERRLNGGAGAGVASSDKQLEKLREKALRTGDYTEITRYKQKLRQNR